MSFRTDLAIDENLQEENGEEIIKRERKNGDITITDITLKSEEKAKTINKQKGRYITLEFPSVEVMGDYSQLITEIKNALETLLKEREKGVLVAGLGNPEITPDAIGPNTAKRIIATRHISGQEAEKMGLKGLKKVSVTTPDVLGKTGIEASETVAAAVKQTNPSAVIAIDALCSKSISRLFSTIQLTDTGISPGSGVKNSRKEISGKTLGVNVVAIGVPTVVEADVIAYELTGNSPEKTAGLIVTPKDVDYMCEKMCEILSSALNEFLQPQIDREVIRSLA